MRKAAVHIGDAAAHANVVCPHALGQAFADEGCAELRDGLRFDVGGDVDFGLRELGSVLALAAEQF